MKQGEVSFFLLRGDPFESGGLIRRGHLLALEGEKAVMLRA